VARYVASRGQFCSRLSLPASIMVTPSVCRVTVDELLPCVYRSLPTYVGEVCGQTTARRGAIYDRRACGSDEDCFDLVDGAPRLTRPWSTRKGNMSGER